MWQVLQMLQLQALLMGVAARRSTRKCQNPRYSHCAVPKHDQSVFFMIRGLEYFRGLEMPLQCTHLNYSAVAAVLFHPHYVALGNAGNAHITAPVSGIFIVLDRRTKHREH